MYLDWTSLVLLCLAGAIAWFWQDSLAAREAANSAAMEACERLSLQFLDGTVAFAKIALGRGANGRLVLRRTYVFDYTANSIERRQGFIVVGARRVETVGYARDEHRPPPRPISSTPPPSATDIEPARVIQLNEWRGKGEQRSQDAGPPPDSRAGEHLDQ
jgi:hypothetical protein